MLVPTELGGLGASLLQASRIQRRLAQASPATALSMNMHLVVTAAALHAHRLGEDSGRLILEDAAADRLFAFGISEAGNERSEEHTSELQSRGHLVCRLALGNNRR